MKTECRVVWCGIILFFALLAGLSQGSDLQGQVTSSDSGTWLAGATVELRSTNGPVQHAAQTDMFGYYRFRNVQEGTYEVKAQMRGYNETNEVVALQSTRERNNLELTQSEPGELLTLWFQVNCVKTGRAISQAPITVKRYNLAGDSLQETIELQADHDGLLEIQNLQAGKYTFEINYGEGASVPGWESFVTNNVLVNGNRQIHARLKPVEQQVTVTVYGYDPVREEDNVQLASVYVEAKPFAPGSSQQHSPLLPPITAVSKMPETQGQPDANTGKAWFTKLAPADWQIKGKRQGYAMQEMAVEVDEVTGELATNTVDITMPINATTLDVLLDAPPYYDVQSLTGAVVHLSGLVETQTEGIDRRIAPEIVTVNGTNMPRARFTRILPGSYQVAVDESVVFNRSIDVEDTEIYTRSFTARFSGNAYADALDDQTNAMHLTIIPQPVRADFTLNVADRVIHFRENQEGTINDMAREFIPRTGQVVKIVMSDYMVNSNDAVDLPEFAVTTDDRGRYSVSVPPGLYGARVDDMPGYWGMQMFSRRKTVGAADGDWEQYNWMPAWPYAGRWTNSAAYLDQYPNDYFFAAGGMVLDSDYQYNHELQVVTNRMPYIRGEVGYVSRTVFGTVVVGITQTNVNSIDLSTVGYMQAAGKTAKLTSGDVEVTGTIRSERSGQASVVFSNLPPGRYTPSINDANLNYSASRDGFQDPFIFDCPQPGHIPATELPDCNDRSIVVCYPFDIQQQVFMHLQYKPHTTNSLSVMYWNAETETYEDCYKRTVLLQCPDFGSLYFNVGTGTMYLPTDRDYTFYAYLLEDSSYGWYKLEKSAAVFDGNTLYGYIGGENANMSGTTQPQIKYNLNLKAQSNDSTPIDVPGVSVTFSDDRVLVAPQIVQDTTDTADIETATHPNWIYETKNISEVRLVENELVVDATAIMKRGLRLRVEVVSATNDWLIEHARITTRYANNVNLNPLPASPLEGFSNVFEYNNPFDASTNIWVTVAADGYITQVIDLNPADAQIDPDGATNRVFMLTGTNAVKLVPLQGPTMHTTTLNRCGGFLPGVKNGGTEDGYDPDAVEEALTLTWTLAATPVTHELPGPNPGDPTRFVRDDIAEVWLVDQRYFLTNTYNDTPLNLPVPVNTGSSKPGVPYSLYRPDHGWTYLDYHVQRPDRKVVYQRVTNFTPQVDGTIYVTNTLYLPDLPPGELTPAVLVRSKMGGISIYEWDWTGDLATNRVVGARLPPWMSVLANVFGAAANIQTEANAFENFLPEGFLSPLPKFTATITHEDQFLNYNYGLATTLKEGSETPNKDMLSLAQGVLGMEVEANLTAGFDGKAREFSLGIGGNVSSEAIELSDYVPGIAEVLGLDPSLDPGPRGAVETVFSESFYGDNVPNQKRTRHSLDGSIGVVLKADFTAQLNAIPVIGPVIRKLGKYVKIKCEGKLKGLTGLKVTRQWETTFPRYDERSSSAAEQPARRIFLGGKEPTTTQTVFNLAFNFGVGMDVSATDNAQASAMIELTGEEGFTGEPALEIETNPIGEYPVIKKVTGSAKANVDASLDYWIDTYENSWSWTLLEINYENSTETAVSISPVTVLSRVIRRADRVPANQLVLRPQILRDPLPMAEFQAMDDGFAFIDMETQGGNMLLRAGARDAAGAYTSVIVNASSTDGMLLASGLARLDTNQWLLLWSEIDAADANNPFASSTVYAVTANADFSSFGTPEAVVSNDLPVTDLYTMPLGSNLACVLSTSLEGPVSQRKRLDGLVRDAGPGTWSAPSSLLGETNLLTVSVIGTTIPAAPAHIAYMTDENDLQAFTWDGQSASAPISILASNTCDPALAGVDAAGSPWLFVARTNSGLRALSYSNGLWGVRSNLLDGQNVSEIAAFPATTTDILLAWTPGTLDAPVYTGLLGLDGQLTTGPVELTANPVGAYSKLRLAQTVSNTITLNALFERNTVKEIRTFDINPATATLIHDDRDCDDMQDHLELHAVDDNTEDQYTLIDDILPDDDYNSNGIPNRIEYGFGTTATGFVTCVIQPPSVTNDARWRLTSVATNWQLSGVTQSVNTTTYTVTFSDVPGWITPSNQLATVTSNAVTNLVATYALPGAAVTNVIVSGPATGMVNQALTFSASVQPVDAATPIVYTWSPEPQSGQATTQTVYQFQSAGTYTTTVIAANSGGAATGSAVVVLSAPPATGNVTARLTPEGAITDGAKWRLTTQSNWYDSSTTQTVVTGSYTMEFKSAIGWSTPASRSIQVAESMTTTTTGLYTCALSLSSTPASLPTSTCTGTVSIIIGTGCPWAAATTTAWLTITSATNGAGSASLYFTAAENTNKSARVGGIQVNDESIDISQKGVINGVLGWLLLLLE